MNKVKVHRGAGCPDANQACKERKGLGMHLIHWYSLCGPSSTGAECCLLGVVKRTDPPSSFVYCFDTVLQ